MVFKKGHSQCNTGRTQFKKGHRWSKEIEEKRIESRKRNGWKIIFLMKLKLIKKQY